jgi:hypothetical protein
MLNITQNNVVAQSLDVVVPTELDSTSYSVSANGTTTVISILCNYPPTVQSYFNSVWGALSGSNSTLNSAATTGCKSSNLTCVGTRSYTASLSGYSATSNFQRKVCSEVPSNPNPQWNVSSSTITITSSDSCSGASFIKAGFLVLASIVALFFY